MATTSYFEEELPAVGGNGKADHEKSSNLLELYISSYSGVHELYLKHVDDMGKESYSILVNMFRSLESALHYLGYLK